MARRRSGKKIDFVHWTRAGFSFLAQAAGSAAQNLFAAAHEPETLLRLRGDMTAYVDAAQPPGGLIQAAVGIVLVPEGTGTTVLWSPITDGDAPWIWIQYFNLGYEEYVTDVIDCPGITSRYYVVDNKAMRVVRNQEVQVVVEQASIGTALSINVVGQMRSLTGQ